MSFKKISLNSIFPAALLAIMVSSSMGLAQDPAGPPPDPKCLKTEAVFDVGSSSTKMKVIKINQCTSKIYQILYPATKDEAKNAKVKMGFEKDLQASIDPATRDPRVDDSDLPAFSYYAQTQAKKIFKQLIDLARRFEPTAYIGVATEAFREAKNGSDFVHDLESQMGDYATCQDADGCDPQKNRVRFKLLVPSQAQEALLEWLGATQDIASKTDIPSSRMVSFGIGGGSMQIGVRLTNGSFEAYQSQLASDKMYDRAKHEVSTNADGSLMPLTKDQIDAMVKIAVEEVNSAMQDVSNKVPSEVRDRVQDIGMETLGVGGVINGALSGIMLCEGFSKKSFTVTDVHDALYNLVGIQKTDPSLCKEGVDPEYADQLPANLALIYGVMRSMGLDSKPIYFSKVDNTYAAPFLDGLATKMVIRKWKPRPKVASVAASATGSQTANGQASLAAGGGQATLAAGPAIAEPKEADLEPVIANDSSAQTCAQYGGRPDATNTCALNTCMPDAKLFCTKYIAATNYCEDTKGHVKLVYKGGICK